jgi:hypothetical protein
MCILFSILHLKHYTKHHLSSLIHYFVQMAIWGCMHSKVAHFVKKQKSTKVHVSKAIKPILIRAHLHIPNMYTSRIFFEIKKKKNYVKELWKYGSILTVQKSLSKVWLWFFKENFHIKIIIGCYTIYWNLIDNLEWNSIWTFLFFIIIKLLMYK